MNRSQLFKKLQRMGKKSINELAFKPQSEAHNTEPVLYGREKARKEESERTEFEAKVYRAGRTWLVRIPKVAALNLDLTPGCITQISIKVIHQERQEVK